MICDYVYHVSQGAIATQCIMYVTLCTHAFYSVLRADYTHKKHLFHQERNKHRLQM
jgi:hypothetical protein